MTEAIEDAKTLIGFADMIDNRLGPISGRDADTIALMMRRVAGNIVIADATLRRTSEMLDKAVATLRIIGGSALSQGKTP